MKPKPKFQNLFILLLVFIPVVALTQSNAPSIKWQRCYGGSGLDETYDIDITSDNGYVFVSTTSSFDGDVSTNNGARDAWIVRADHLGVILWEHSYGGFDYEYPQSIQETSDGGFIMGAYSNSNNGHVSGNNGVNDFWVVKLDSLGVIMWQKCLGGSSWELLSSIQETSDGGYIIAGSSESNNGDVTGNNGNWDYWIVKTDSLANIEWQKSLGGGFDDKSTDIKQTFDGGYIVIGSTESNNAFVSGNHGEMDYWFVKLDNLGVVEWQKCYGGSQDDFGYSVQQTVDSGFIIAGSTYSNDGDVSNNQGIGDYWLVKTDASGNIIWEKSYGGSSTETANEIIQTEDGGYAVIGVTWSDDGDISINRGSADYWMLKIDEFGNIQWQKTVGGSGLEYARAICEKPSGGFILAGHTKSNDGDVNGNHGNADAWLVDLDKPSGFIRGYAYKDSNANCEKDSIDVAIKQCMIKQTQPSTKIINTDSLGNFKLPIFDTTSYSFELIIPQYLQVLTTQICDSAYTVAIDFLGTDTAGFNFGLELAECPILLVDISSNRRRPCFNSTTTLSYRNDGNTPETNVQIIVELADSVHVISASQNFSYNSLGQLIFDIDTLYAGESGIITIIDSMECELSLTNTQACSKAWISPANTCYNNFVNPTPWDSSNLVIDWSLELNSVGDTCYYFEITNNGSDMQDSMAYNIYSDIGFVQSDSFLLTSGESLFVLVCDVDYAQIFINQHPNHPSAQIVFVSPPTTDTNAIIIADYIPVDNQLETSIECLAVTNAYDPNDKQVTPSGWGPDNFVSTEASLKYKIRFQNTGTDTAYNIRIIDTIDVNVFDVSSLILGGSSYPYDFEILNDSGKVIFDFFFADINLPDSVNNEPLSHGFVNFKINAYDSVQQGTIAQNFADIYFDFNPAIRTNTSLVTLKDTLPSDQNPVSIELNSCITTIEEVLVEACDSVFFEGQWLYQNQFIRDTFQTSNFCDSIIQTSIVIFESYDMQGPDLTACDSVQNNSNWYFNSTQVVDTFISTDGCDSIIHTNITIHNSTTNDTTLLIGCDSVFYDGLWYSSSELVSNTFSTVNNCDSIYAVNINVTNSSILNIVDTLNQDMYYNLPDGDSTNVAGEYTFALQNIAGCDSIVNVNLYERNYTSLFHAPDLTKVFKVYPNPVTNNLFIERTEHEEVFSLEFRNKLNQIVYQQAKQRKKSIINTSQWAEGVYNLTIRDKYDKPLKNVQIVIVR